MRAIRMTSSRQKTRDNAPGTDDANETQDNAPATDAARARNRIGQLELVATLLLAFATILTAWSAFQSAKWSGTQAIHFANAGALRTESAKAAALAESQQVIDVSTFVAWVQALAEERKTNPHASVGPDGTYVPTPNSLSGFLFERLRSEFRPAVEAWLAEHPLANEQAAPTPFQLPQYHLAAAARSQSLERQADHEASLARRDNQRSDNYILLTVLFASVLFFAGISSKLTAVRNRTLVVVVGVVCLLAGAGILATFPIEL